jgi:isopenicillin-N N-acyltransferase like protein
MTPRLIALALVVALAPAARAQDAKRFPAAKHGAGELRYVEGVPVLTVRGTPAEMGEQFGALAVKTAPDLDGLITRFLEDTGQKGRYPLVLALGTRLLPGFPAHHRAEMEAAAKAAGGDLGRHVFANTVADLSSGMGCSTVVVEPGRSKTGSPLFGRNFDWYPTKGIHDHTVLAVYRGTGKRAFAAATVTPIAGVVSGMNDAGLCLTVNEIHLRRSKDQAAFNWGGTPMLLSFRRVLEECKTVAEAEALLRGMKRTTSCCLTVCDGTGGAVFEITPKTLAVRPAENGVCCCTNHFRTDELSVGNKCWRFDKLAPLYAAEGKLGVGDVFARLDEVNQGKATLQSMVFEPRARVLHFAYGEGPATKRPPVRLELGPLFEEK